MKKLICLAMLVIAFTVSAFAAEISSADDLLALMNTSDMWSGDYTLTADIDLSTATNGLSQTPIGTSSIPFSGTFDGAGHEISGINISGTKNTGLFGYTNGATIKNLTISGSVTSSGDYTGGLIGYAKGALVVEKCHNKCTVTGEEYIGGIAGYLYGSDTSSSAVTMSVIECMNSGTINAIDPSQSDAGGIAGLARGVGALRDCLNTGLVTSVDENPGRAYLGGIVGRTYSYAKITNCYNATAPVTKASSTSNVRGIVGNPGANNASNNYFADGLGMSDSACGTAYSADDFATLNVNSVWYNEESPRLIYFDGVTVEEVTLDSEIGTADELLTLMNYPKFWEGDYTLTADIDLSTATSELSQTPIGTSDVPFSGTFDGAGYEISGINLSGTKYVALFGYTNGATIKNLTISGTVTSSGSYTGGLIGYALGALTVEKCHNKCTVTGHIYIGGIAGYVKGNDESASDTIETSIIECMNSGTIYAIDATQSDGGGILGVAWNVGAIRDCYNEGLVTNGDVTLDKAYIGGICGKTHLYARITNCYNVTAPVTKSSDTTYVRAITGRPNSKYGSDNFFADGLGMSDADFGSVYSADDFATLNVNNVWYNEESPRLAYFVGIVIEEVTLDSEIGTADELLTLMNYSEFWEGDYTLTADIDLSEATNGLSQKPIGTVDIPFSGTFEGAGYEISGINLSGTKYVALFGYTNGATIKNLTISGTITSSGMYTGGFIGYALGALNVEKCHNKCTVTGLEYIGGIAGYIKGNDSAVTVIATSVINCMNSGTINALDTAQSDAGGIVGLAWNVGAIRNCYNEGLITTGDTDPAEPYVGGICGRNHIYAPIENCYNAVAPVTKASDTTYVRGILGFAAASGATCSFYKDGLGMHDSATVTGYSKEDFVALNAYSGWIDRNDPKPAAFYECTHSVMAYSTITPSTCTAKGSATEYCDSCMKEYGTVELPLDENVHTTYRFAYMSESEEYEYVCNGCDTVLNSIDGELAIIPTFASANDDGTVTVILNIRADSPIVAAGFEVVAPSGATLVNVASDVIDDNGFIFAGASEYTGQYRMSVISNTGTEKTLDAFVTLTYEIENAVLGEKYLFEVSVLEAYNDASSVEFTTADAELTYIEKVKGDVDGDGTVSIADVMLVLKAVANAKTIENTDMNGDGLLGLVDVLRILKKAVQ